MIIRSVFFVCFSFLLHHGLWAQNPSMGTVERQMVVIEIGTGTWCTYCPGAAMGADDLVQNGHQVAIIEYHNGDLYANTASNARNIYNGVNIFPTAIFDGLSRVTGGNHTQSMYPSYLPEYNNRISEPSGYSIQLETSNNGPDYTVTITVEKHDPAASHTDLKLRLALTESHIPQNWQGQTELNFVARMMIPDHEGTTVDFLTGNIQTYILSFTLDTAWNPEHCELVAFLQTDSDKEILQGTKKSLAVAEYSLDAAIMAVPFPDVPICGDSVSPVVVIKNNGSETLTSLNFRYRVNAGNEFMYSWTGSLPFPYSAQVVLPTIYFEQASVNHLMVTSANPNGFHDQNVVNDTAGKVFYEAPKVYTGTVHLELKTDNYGYETSWKLFDEEGDILYQGDDYANNQIYSYNLDLPDTGCFEFVIYDSFGDGICSGSGNGYFKLVDADGGLIGNGCDFGAEGHVSFKRETNVGAGQLMHGRNGIKTVPNPVDSETSLILELSDIQYTTVELASISGVSLQQLFKGELSRGTNIIKLDMDALQPGLYLIRVRTGQQVWVEKVMKI